MASVNKVTVTIPEDMFLQLNNLKKEFKLSMSAIYKEALEAYITQKEVERWERGALLASQDEEYMTLCKQNRDD